MRLERDGRVGAGDAVVNGGLIGATGNDAGREGDAVGIGAIGSGTEAAGVG